MIAAVLATLDVTLVVVLLALVAVVAGAALWTGTRRRRIRRGPVAPPKPAPLPPPPPPPAPPPPTEPVARPEELPPVVERAAAPAAEPPVLEVPAPRWRERLARTRSSFGDAITGVFRKPVLAEEDWEDVEAVLLQADVGVAATQRILADLREKTGRATTSPEVLALLRAELLSILGDADRTLGRKAHGLTIWVVAGVNGTGKTTTIGKLAGRLASEGCRVVLAAADTFRAAADEQLETWASRAGAEVVKHAPGADPAAVAFDGVRAATARGADALIVDTAGRLHTKRNLMEELAKIRRVIEREAGPPDEVLLVLDATTGQNGIAQARAFVDVVGCSGIALTKLDGTAKGGIVIACQQELGLPVKLVGLGEGLGDLAPFDPEAFVDALIG